MPVSRRGWVWASIVAAVLVTPAAALVVREYFTEYRFRETTWEPRAASEDGRTITVEYVTCRGNSQSLDRIDRAETASTVTLTVVLRESSRDDCEDIAVFRTTEVDLATPLRDRRLIDGRTGRRPEFFSQPAE